MRATILTILTVCITAAGHAPLAAQSCGQLRVGGDALPGGRVTLDFDSSLIAAPVLLVLGRGLASIDLRIGDQTLRLRVRPPLDTVPIGVTNAVGSVRATLALPDFGMPARLYGQTLAHSLQPLRLCESPGTPIDLDPTAGLNGINWPEDGTNWRNGAFDPVGAPAGYATIGWPRIQQAIRTTAGANFVRLGVNVDTVNDARSWGEWTAALATIARADVGVVIGAWEGGRIDVARFTRIWSRVTGYANRFANVWGYELINEPRGYPNTDAGARRYRDDILAVHRNVRSWGGKRILIQGLGKGEFFDRIARFAPAVPRRVWTYHTYPFFDAPSNPNSIAAWRAHWSRRLAPVGGARNVIVTEAGASTSKVDDPSSSHYHWVRAAAAHFARTGFVWHKMGLFSNGAQDGLFRRSGANGLAPRCNLVAHARSIWALPRKPCR